MPNSILRRNVIAGVVTGISTWARVAAQEKVNKTDANYQDQPKGQQRCEICINFEPPDQCRFVAGPISPHGWCRFFAARENAQ